MASEFTDFYKVLGVQYGVSDVELKKAYRELMKKYHPDVNPTVNEDLVKEINEAYEVLSTKEKREEYDIQYQLHLLAEEERARRAQATQNRRTAESTQHTRSTKERSYTEQSRTTPGDEQFRNGARNASYYERRGSTEAKKASVKTKQGFFQQIKKDWDEIRTEEKKYPFSKRHASIEKNIYKKYFPDTEVADETLTFKLKKGTLHIASELFYQLEKLTHITEDTIPRFVIRNRGTIALSLALGLLFSSAGGRTDTKEMPIAPLVTTGTYSAADLPTENLAEEEQTSEAKNDRAYTVYRDYTIEFGDTLSELAEDANCSVEELQRLNGLSSSMIRFNDQLLIPYHIESGDLKYASYSVYYPTGMDLATFAAKYDTTVDSIKALNSEALEDGQIVSDTVLVPNFASPSEIREAKSLETPTQYHKQ